MRQSSMKPADILRLAIQNLKRRKSRTILTGIGVMIGCTSIIVMVSIGTGMSESMKSSLQDMGSLYDITVYSNFSYDTMGNRLTDETSLTPEKVEEFRYMDHVKAASGILSSDTLSFQATADNGRYACDWMNIMAMDPEMMKEMGLEVLEGTDDLTSDSVTTIPVLAGQYAAYTYRDTMRPEGSNRIDRYGTMAMGGMIMESGDQEEEAIPDPYFNSMDETLDVTVNTYSSEEATPVRFKFKPVGVVREDYNIDYTTAEGYLMDLSSMEKIIAQAWKAAGKPVPKTVFDRAIVRADDISAVEDIEKTIQEMGYSTSSMMSIRKSMEEQSMTIQLVLGGLGAVSFVVAAIGIANTMVMSISERTREIGIMKALGCPTKDIRYSFLTEAGLIGLLGGILGILLSYLISVIINYFTWQQTSMTETFWTFLLSSPQRISYIPWWLTVFGLLFSVAVGMLSGYMPARRAVKISALDAIRRE